jgi:hypothetical protein
MIFRAKRANDFFLWNNPEQSPAAAGVESDPLLGLGQASEQLIRPRFTLTASGQIIALSRARMNNKYSLPISLGCPENGETKDEAREECWFRLPATNAGGLAEAASVRDRSVCPSAKAATA